MSNPFHVHVISKIVSFLQDEWGKLFDDYRVRFRAFRFESLFQIILIGVLSLSLGSIEMMGILFF